MQNYDDLKKQLESNLWCLFYLAMFVWNIHDGLLRVGESRNWVYVDGIFTLLFFILFVRELIKYDD